MKLIASRVRGRHEHNTRPPIKAFPKPTTKSIEIRIMVEDRDVLGRDEAFRADDLDVSGD